MNRSKIKKGLKKKNTVVVSGYFNPLHVGHIDYLREAKNLGRRLVVIVNSDYQVGLKKSVPFMNQWDRLKIITALQYVDIGLIAEDKDKTVCKTLEKVCEHYKEEGGRFIFANGGDRKEGNVPEEEVCKKLDIEMIYGVGGKKVESSSSLIAKANVKKHNKKDE